VLLLSYDVVLMHVGTKTRDCTRLSWEFGILGESFANLGRIHYDLILGLQSTPNETHAHYTYMLC
jgi:hypothetical protein